MAKSRDPLRSALDRLALPANAGTDKRYLVSMLRRLGYSEREIEEALGPVAKPRVIEVEYRRRRIRPGAAPAMPVAAEEPVQQAPPAEPEPVAPVFEQAEPEEAEEPEATIKPAAPEPVAEPVEAEPLPEPEAPSFATPDDEEEIVEFASIESRPKQGHVATPQSWAPPGQKAVAPPAEAPIETAEAWPGEAAQDPQAAWQQVAEGPEAEMWPEATDAEPWDAPTEDDAGDLWDAAPAAAPADPQAAWQQTPEGHEGPEAEMWPETTDAEPWGTPAEDEAGDLWEAAPAEPVWEPAADPGQQPQSEGEWGDQSTWNQPGPGADQPPPAAADDEGWASWDSAEAKPDWGQETWEPAAGEQQPWQPAESAEPFAPEAPAAGQPGQRYDMGGSQEPYEYNGYILHYRDENGARVYYMSKGPSTIGEPTPLPPDHEVHIIGRTGEPYVKRRTDIPSGFRAPAQQAAPASSHEKRTRVAIMRGASPEEAAALARAQGLDVRASVPISRETEHEDR